MKLYHYTCEDHLPSILAEGLHRGEIPVSPTRIMRRPAVWLTTDSSPEGHGLKNGGTFVVTPNIAPMLSMKLPVGTVIHWADKHKIRIRIEFLTSKTRGLHKWLDFAKKEKIDRDWLKRLHTGAGDDPKPHTWWLWFGTLSPETFQAVEVRTPEGDYVSLLQRLDLLEDDDVRQAIIFASASVDVAAA